MVRGQSFVEPLVEAAPPSADQSRLHQRQGVAVTNFEVTLEPGDAEQALRR